MSRSLHIAAAAIAAASLSFTLFSTNASAAAKAAGSCTSKPYAYAGLISNSTGYGIKATITATKAATVRSGHVAGWIGVGSPNAGPGGEAMWLQAGLNMTADGRAELYGELTLPGRSPIYKTLGQVATGKAYRLAVLEVPGKPGTWQVYLNGKPASKQVYLPGSHGAFQPMAITESWNGGTPTCNDFSYRFDSVLVAGKPGSWQRLGASQTLADSGYRVTKTTAGFTAGRGI